MNKTSILWGGVLTPFRTFLFAMISVAMLFSFSACSSGDDDDGANLPPPKDTTKTETVQSVSTSGTISSNSVTSTTNELSQKTVTVMAGDDSKYEFTETESGDNASMRSSQPVPNPAGKGGKWTLYKKDSSGDFKAICSGSYTGDIEQFNTIAQAVSGATSGGFSLELKVEKALSEEGELVDVSKNDSTNNTFTFEVKENKTFEATVPEVKVEVPVKQKEEEPATQEDTPSVTISVPSAKEMANKIFRIGESVNGQNGSERYLSFSADGSTATETYFTIYNGVYSKATYGGATYTYKDGSLLYSDTENQGKHGDGAAYSFIKVASTIYLSDGEIKKLDRTSGTGLYATFSRSWNGEGDTYENSYPDTLENGAAVTCVFTEVAESSGSESYTFNSNKTFTGSSSSTHSRNSNYDYKDSSGTVVENKWSKFSGTENSTSSGEFINNNVILTLNGTKKSTSTSGGEDSKDGKWTNQPSTDTTRVSIVMLYDGTTLYPVDGTLTAVDALPESSVFNITVTQPQNGTVYCQYASRTVGETTEIQVTPNSGYEIKKVKVLDEKGTEISVAYKQIYSGTEYYTFTMPKSDVTVSVEFMAEGTKYKVSTHIAAGYTWSYGGTEPAFNGDTYGETVYSAGKTVSFNAYARTSHQGVVLDSISAVDASGNKVELTSSGKESVGEWDGNINYPYSFVMPESDVTITVSFKSVTRYSITFPSDISEKAKISVSKPTFAVGRNSNFWEGLELTVFVEPKSAMYSVKKISASANGTDIELTKSETQEAYTFVMPAGNVTFSAEFNELPTKKITATQPKTGRINLEEGKTDKNIDTLGVPGSKIEVWLYPDDDYELDTLLIKDSDGNNVQFAEPSESGRGYSGESHYYKTSFTMPEKDVTISATFKAIVHTITIADSITGGTVSASPKTAVAGDKITLTFAPNDGYKVKIASYDVSYRWGGTYGGQSPVTVTLSEDKKTGTFTMPQYDVTVEGIFVSADTVENGD